MVFLSAGVIKAWRSVNSRPASLAPLLLTTPFSAISHSPPSAAMNVTITTCVSYINISTSLEPSMGKIGKLDKIYMMACRHRVQKGHYQMSKHVGFLRLLGNIGGVAPQSARPHIREFPRDPKAPKKLCDRYKTTADILYVCPRARPCSRSVLGGRQGSGSFSQEPGHAS